MPLPSSRAVSTEPVSLEAMPFFATTRSTTTSTLCLRRLSSC